VPKKGLKKYYKKYYKKYCKRETKFKTQKSRLAAQACIIKIKVKIKTVFQGKDLLKLIA